MWEDTGVPGGNQRLREGDNNALSLTTTADPEDQTAQEASMLTTTLPGHPE